ncbi:uncharacterized protein LOC117343642 isoform X2 [Pecten maximus]|uniref:uncharacterized protein LOC117343642 isoform X2 n=1 Tax=Pecten maximus TaxID=6579 RepID=UPI001458F190|nr:uncharacterized protein LOC117343642 isoform X2 [Pecten maximus]
MDESLSLDIDAAPISDEENESADQHVSTAGHLYSGNLPTGMTYSFINQLFSPKEREKYICKIKCINEAKPKYSALLSHFQEFGDVLMVCTGEDFDNAEKYCEFLKTLEMRGGPEQSGVTVKASMEIDEVISGSRKFAGFADVSKRFTYIFLYISKQSLNDKEYRSLQQDCLLQEGKEDSLVLVYADGVECNDIPSHLKPLMSVRECDKSNDIKSALIKKLESKLYIREANEKNLCIEIVQSLESLFR